jgi:Neuraminidase (sialidase)
MNEGNQLLKADISIASSGDNTVIAAPTHGFIAIDHINFIPTTAVNVQIKNGVTNYGGAYPLDTKQAFTIENAIQNASGIITCKPGEAFIINLGSAVQVSGFIRYRIVI